jgi:hypothetical protein
MDSRTAGRLDRIMKTGLSFLSLIVLTAREINFLIGMSHCVDTIAGYHKIGVFKTFTVCLRFFPLFLAHFFLWRPFRWRFFTSKRATGKKKKEIAPDSLGWPCLDMVPARLVSTKSLKRQAFRWVERIKCGLGALPGRRLGQQPTEEPPGRTQQICGSGLLVATD